MHARNQAARLLGDGVVGIDFGLECFTIVVAVGLHSEGSQWHEVDAVAVFQSGHVAVAQGDAQHVGDASLAAGGGTHPQRVVVAPLEVELAVVHQRVHNKVCTRAAVVHVAQDVQLVDTQSLNHVAHGHDERVGLTGGDDGLNDAVEVGLLIVVAGRFVQQLLDDVSEVGRQSLAHLRTGVLRRYRLAHLHQSVQGDVVEVVEVLLVAGVDVLQLLLRIIDERTELADVIGTERSAEDVGHLALDVARCILQDVAKRFMLAMNIGHEVLRALGQVENRFEVDNLGRRSRNVGKRLRKQLQHAAVGINLVRCINRFSNSHHN